MRLALTRPSTLLKATAQQGYCHDADSTNASFMPRISQTTASARRWVHHQPAIIGGGYPGSERGVTAVQAEHFASSAHTPGIDPAGHGRGNASLA